VLVALFHVAVIAAFVTGLASRFVEKLPEDIIAKVAGDFAKKGVALDETRVRVELERCATEAKKQLGPQ